MSGRQPREPSPEPSEISAATLRQQQQPSSRGNSSDSNGPRPAAGNDNGQGGAATPLEAIRGWLGVGREPTHPLRRAALTVRRMLLRQGARHLGRRPHLVSLNGWNDPDSPTNEVTTSKYNIVSFLPVFLFEMFSRVAYIYFLLQAVLAWIEVISPFATGFGSTVALGFVLLVAAIKAGSEDWKRHREDARTNCSTAHLVAPDGSVRHLAWRDVRVGQVLQVFDGEQVPADLLCLATGLEEGVCFVRTTNLDGETNLKVRHPADLAGCATDTFRSIMQIRAVLECDPPSNSLHTFNGRLTIHSCGGGAQPGGAHSNDGAEDRKGHWDHGSLFASLQQQSGKSALLQPLSDAAASAGGEAASGGRSSISSAGAQSEAHQASSAALPPAGAQQPEQQGDEEAPPPAQPVGAAQAPATAPAQQGQAQGPAQRKAQQEQKAGREEQKAGGGEEQKEGREKQQKEGGGEEEQDSAEALKARVEQEAQRLALPRRAVNMNGMLLRGCELRNSRWALGLVVYAGPETRIQMNALAPPLKVGSFDRFLNVQISIIILVQLALCLASALAGYAWRQTAGLKRYYMALDEPGHGNFQNPATYLSLTAITFWVLYSYLVPLSLFVTLEIVRFWQAAIFINSDPKLVCTETGEAARARNSSLNEDLARVEYIFADKTGTLTRNDMRLRMLGLKDVSYGERGFELEAHPGAQGLQALRRFDARLAEAVEAARDAKLWEALARGGGSSAALLALHSGRLLGEGQGRSSDASQQLRDAVSGSGQQLNGEKKETPSGGGNSASGEGEAASDLGRRLLQAAAQPQRRRYNGVGRQTGGRKQDEGEAGSSGQGRSSTEAADTTDEDGDNGGSKESGSGDSSSQRHHTASTAEQLLCACHLADFWTVVCLCHSIIVGTTAAPDEEEKSPSGRGGADGDDGADGGSGGGGRPQFQGTSPDEVALVEAGDQMGFRLRGRSHDSLTLELQGVEVTHDLLNVMEFSSDRKRMSVVARCADGSLRLLTKGADSAVLGALRGGDDDARQGALRKAVERLLHGYSSQGLRTLVLAAKLLDPEWYRAWDRRYQEAASSMDGREQRLREVISEIEVDLELVGVAAIEDKLQEGVPQAIAQLLAGNMKVWMITGDKQETAINIARSARLFSAGGDQPILTLNASGSKEEALACVAQLLEATGGREQRETPAGGGDESNRGAEEQQQPRSGGQSNSDKQTHQLVVDGKTLGHILMLAASPKGAAAGTAEGQQAEAEAREQALRLQSDFAALCSRCGAVVACRTSPAQKAAIVRVMRRQAAAAAAQGGHKSWAGIMRRLLGHGSSGDRRAMHHGGRAMLAIGDGANDVAMIQAADVGVGVLGREGRQAANVSDYAVPQFRHLVRLLLVHGQLSHYRLSRLIKYSFYKNVTFWGVLFLFQFFCGFSGQPLVDELSASAYNVVFTSLPPLVLALLDRQIGLESYMRHPGIYGRSSSLTTGNFWKTGVLLGLAHAAACFFVPFLAAQPEGARPTASLWMVGQAAFAAILGAVSLEACLIVRFWTWPFAASVLLSYGLFFPFVALLPRIEHGLRLYRDATHGTGGLLFSTAYFWLSILAVYFITFGMRYIERFCKWYARPDDVMLLAERDRAGLPPAANYTDQQPSDEGSTNGGSNGGAAMA